VLLKHDFRDAVIRISVCPKSHSPVCEPAGNRVDLNAVTSLQVIADALHR